MFRPRNHSSIDSAPCLAGPLGTPFRPCGRGGRRGRVHRCPRLSRRHLRLLFVSCHPECPATQQIALAMRIVSAFSDATDGAGSPRHRGGDGAAHHALRHDGDAAGRAIVRFSMRRRTNRLPCGEMSRQSHRMASFVPLLVDLHRTLGIGPTSDLAQVRQTISAAREARGQECLSSSVYLHCPDAGPICWAGLTTMIPDGSPPAPSAS
jgi:hypothetical protein